VHPGGDLVTVTVTDFGPPGGDESENVVLVFDYVMENHAADAEIVRMTMDVFEVSSEAIGEEQYEELTEQGLADVDEGRLGLQWSVEVAALDASGEVLGTTTLQSTCGTRGGESVTEVGRFYVYQDDPAFTADEVAEVTVDTTTLEVLPLFLSDLDALNCADVLSSDR
jgi:hypothetical protein